MYIHTCRDMYIYIYIYRERERDTHMYASISLSLSLSLYTPVRGGPGQRQLLQQGWLQKTT